MFSAQRSHRRGLSLRLIERGLGLISGRFPTGSCIKYMAVSTNRRVRVLVALINIQILIRYIAMTKSVWYMVCSRWYMPCHNILTRILQTIVSGIPLVLGLRTRMQDPYVNVAFGPPRYELQSLLPIVVPY